MPEEPNPVAAVSAETVRTVLSLPGLREAGPVGGGCCAKAVDDAVREELDSWPALQVADLDLDNEKVSVTVQAGRSDQLTDVIEALRDLGLENVEVVATLDLPL